LEKDKRKQVETSAKQLQKETQQRRRGEADLKVLNAEFATAGLKGYARCFKNTMHQALHFFCLPSMYVDGVCLHDGLDFLGFLLELVEV